MRGGCQRGGGVERAAALRALNYTRVASAADVDDGLSLDEPLEAAALITHAQPAQCHSLALLL